MLVVCYTIVLVFAPLNAKLKNEKECGLVEK